MKLAEAKKYVAEKLGVSLADLVDSLVMHEVRGELRRADPAGVAAAVAAADCQPPAQRFPNRVRPRRVERHRRGLARRCVLALRQRGRPSRSSRI